MYQDQNGIITITQDSVNNTTALQAPLESVKKIGKVLPRLLHYMLRKYARVEGVTLPPSEVLCPSGGSNSPAVGAQNLT